MNISFEYMVRDEGNYKDYNTVVFLNPKNLNLEEIKEEMEIEKYTFFIPSDCDLIGLQFDIETGADYWHEWFELLETDQPASEEQTISQFIEKYEGMN